MAGSQERTLAGGAQMPEPTLVEGTVRRSAHARSPQVQELLRHLEAEGFDGAPRPLGYDDQGREVVSFIEGDVLDAPPYRLSDACLVSAAHLVRRFHDAAATSPLRGDAETVCHGDLGPHNTVFRNDRAIAIIDWSETVAPGSRAEDFAHAVWCFADLIEPDVPIKAQARAADLMCAEYPGMTPAIVVDELAARFLRARDRNAATGNARPVAVFERLLQWLDEHGDQIVSGG